MRATSPPGLRFLHRNLKIDGWVSLSLNNRIVTGNPRDLWTAVTVEQLLMEGRKMERLDGKGRVQTDLSRKGKEV
jgi:hypothetical protein